MITIEKRTEIAHDLVQIHQERMKFYEQAEKFINLDEHFYNCIRSIINQCRAFILELRPFAEFRSADPADYSEFRGDIYNRFQIQGLTAGTPQADLISTCEENEKAITAAYENALTEEPPVDKGLQQVISRQLRRVFESLSLLQSHKKPTLPNTISKEKKSHVMWSTRYE